MCMSLRIELREMAEVLIKVRKMAFALEMSIKLGKSLSMSGDLYPSDIAPVLAPNKHGQMVIFPMVWGFTHKATNKHIANCCERLLIQRYCGKIHSTGEGVFSLLHGTMNGDILYMKKTVAVCLSIEILKRSSMLFRPKALTSLILLGCTVMRIMEI
ncbi:hypothetical protein SAMN02910265_02412 [Ruminococcus flavefaciens]|uniref:Uncharacterized protein n=1 Tax=Ruminococcus flavefaciens TaxID=1265 RepID=A0A1H6KFJ7_RUMFL|nr:hypothetical protein SAMN02910265_02412 [Ruminococcus flavefaciens]